MGSAAAQEAQPEPAKASPAAYQKLLEDGIRSNSLGRHSVAEKSFRAALASCEARQDATFADCGDPAMRLALELSNQERFEEADLLLGRLEKAIRDSKSSLSLPRFLTYRAMDLANRGDYDGAMKLIADANQKRKALLRIAFREARTAEPAAKQRLDQTMIELAHGLYVQASISFRLGKIGDAKVTAHLVRALVSKIENIPDWWIAFADALLADIELREGNIEAAEKRLRLALKAKQVALGNTRAVALSYMALGAVFHEARRDRDAVDTSRPGLSILRGELRQAPGISIERLEPFLEASLKIAEKEPGRRATLHAEMFAAAQLARTSQTARSVAQMAARFASGRPEIAKLVRSLQSQTQLRDELRITLGRATIASGGRNTRETGQAEKILRPGVEGGVGAVAADRDGIPGLRGTGQPDPGRRERRCLHPETGRGAYILCVRRSRRFRLRGQAGRGDGGARGCEALGNRRDDPRTAHAVRKSRRKDRALRSGGSVPHVRTPARSGPRRAGRGRTPDRGVVRRTSQSAVLAAGDAAAAGRAGPVSAGILAGPQIRAYADAVRAHVLHLSQDRAPVRRAAPLRGVRKPGLQG